MKNLIKFAFVLALGFSLSACDNKKEENKTEKPTIKIGATLPLSGNMAYLGHALQKGALLAIDDLNSQENNKFHYEFVVEDDQMMPQKSSLNAQKLIRYDKVQAIITTLASSAHAVNTIAENSKVIAFHHSHAPDAVKGKYNFQNLVLDTDLQEKLVDFIKNKKYQKIALFFQKTSAGEEVAAKLKNMFNDLQIKDFFYQSNIDDFKMLVASLKSFNPDLIIVYAYSPLIEKAGKEVLRYNISGDKIGLDLSNATNKIEFFENYYSLNASNGNKEFQQKFGNAVNFQAPYVYDSIQIIAKAFEDAKTSNSEDAIHFLIKIKDYKGVSGKIRQDKYGQFHSTPVLYKIKKGVPVIVEE